MTPTEAVALAGYMRAHFPSQPIDEYTADALSESLAPYSLADCRAAVLAIARHTHDHAERQKWCSPTDVYAEVRRHRADRLEDAVLEPPPNADPDDVAGYLRWLKGARQAIADGLPAPTFATPAVASRDVVKELGHVGQSVDSALATRPLREAHAAARRDLQAAEVEKAAARDARQAELEQMRTADREARAALPADERTAR